MPQSRTKSEAEIKKVITRAMGGAPVLMFYKGISLPYHCDEHRVEDFLLHVRAAANNQIERAKKRGDISEYLQASKDYVDCICRGILTNREKLSYKSCDDLFDEENPDLGDMKTVCATWYLNVEILLQAGKIKNDNEHGWFIPKIL